MNIRVNARVYGLLCVHICRVLWHECNDCYYVCCSSSSISWTFPRMFFCYLMLSQNLWLWNNNKKKNWNYIYIYSLCVFVRSEMSERACTNIHAHEHIRTSQAYPIRKRTQYIENILCKQNDNIHIYGVYIDKRSGWMDGNINNSKYHEWRFHVRSCSEYGSLHVWNLVYIFDVWYNLPIDHT